MPQVPYRCSNCGDEVRSELAPGPGPATPVWTHLSVGSEVSCAAIDPAPWQPVYQFRDKLIRVTGSLQP